MKNCKTSRKPECSRCKNHNIHVGIKGHKRFCLYSFCKCTKCILTAERQRIMAKQVKIRRDQAQDEEMKKSRELTEQTSCENNINEDDNFNENVENESLTCQSPINNEEILNSNDMQQDVNFNKFQISLAMDFLMSILNIPDNIVNVTILFSLLKRCKFNMTATYNKIIQAQQELKFLASSTKIFEKSAHSMYQCHSYPPNYLFRNLTMLSHARDGEADNEPVGYFEYFTEEERNEMPKISEMEESDDDLPELLRIVSPS